MAVPRVQLKRIVKIVNGGTPTPAEENWNGRIPWATPVDLNKVNGGFLDTTLRSLSKIGVKTGSVLVPEGSVILSTRAPIGYTAVATNQISFNQGCKALVPLRPAETDSRYLRYAIQASVENLEALGKGSTFLELSTSDLASFRIPWPEYRAQKRIADELDRKLAEIDKFIAECAQLSALTDERRLAAINSVIEPLLDNTTPIKHLGTLTSGLTLGATYNEPLESYPYLRVANVQAGMVDLRDIKEVAVPPSVALENMLQKDDVLMTEGGDRDKLGRGAIWSDEISPMLHQNHVFAFRCNKEKLIPEFLVYCLESSYARRYFENNARQSTNLASTNSAIVKNFKIPIKSIPDQIKIINSLSENIRIIESIRPQINEIKHFLIERKHSIHSSLF